MTKAAAGIDLVFETAMIETLRLRNSKQLTHSTALQTRRSEHAHICL